MPGMNGRELAKLLETSRPGTRVLYLSGYGRRNHASRHFAKRLGIPAKAVHAANAVSGKLREVLSEPKGGFARQAREVYNASEILGRFAGESRLPARTFGKTHTAIR